MTFINSHHTHQHGNRSRRSHSSNGARRHSGHHFSNGSRSNRHDHAGRSRRNRMRSHMSRMGNHQSNQLHGSRRGDKGNRHNTQYCQRHPNDIRKQDDSRFQNQSRNNNNLNSINQLLQNFGNGNNSIDQILQGFLGGNQNENANTNSGDTQQLIQSLTSELTSSNNGLSSILNGFGNEQTGLEAADLINPNPIHDQFAQLGFDSNLINSNDTDPLAEIQSLLQGLDMGNFSSLLQDVSAGDLSGLLQQETGMSVSSDEITQLLQQLGLSPNITTDLMPVELGNNDVSNDSTMPEIADTDSLADIQSLLQGFDMGSFSSLLQDVSASDLSELLQQETGMNISSAEITQLLQQLGLTAVIDANNSPTAGPADTSNTVNTPAVTNASDSNNDDIQSLLQSIDPDDITLLLESVSIEQLTAMLQQESGLTISTDDINQLLQQLQQNTDMPNSSPIPVEADNRIGDGAPDLGDLLGQTNNTNTTTSSDINEALQSIDPALLSELLQMVSLDDLASMLQQESDVSTSAEQIQQLLDQVGLTNTPTTPNTNPTTIEPNNNNSETTPVDAPAANTEEIQGLLDTIDSKQFASLFDLFSTEELAQMLSQEGTDISANEVENLLSQLGLSAA